MTLGSFEPQNPTAPVTPVNLCGTSGCGPVSLSALTHRSGSWGAWPGPGSCDTSGVGVGFILTIVVDYIGGFAFCFCLVNTLVALFICTVVGVLAGIYPAVQSTRYEPVAALQG